MNNCPCVEPVISFSERGTQNCSIELLRPTRESTQTCWRAFFFLLWDFIPHVPGPKPPTYGTFGSRKLFHSLFNLLSD